MQITNIKRIILTGSTQTGKTKYFIPKLQELGFGTVPEITDVYLQRHFNDNKKDADVWGQKHRTGKLNRLFKIREELNLNQPTNMSRPIIFFDRGDADFIVYCEKRKLPVTSEMRSILEATHYDIAFLFPVPTDFKYRPEKTTIEHTRQEAQEHVAQLRNMYNRLNIPVEDVPEYNDIELKLKFVLNKLNELVNF